MCMSNKEESVRQMKRRLWRIIDKHCRLGEKPLRFADGVALSAREVHFVQAVGECRGVNIKTLAGRLGVTKSAASQMVTKLVAKGLFSKEKAAESNKEVQVILTPEGEATFRAYDAFRLRHLRTLVSRLDDFSDAEVATAAAVLAVVESMVDDRMREVFGEEEKERIPLQRT